MLQPSRVAATKTDFTTRVLLCKNVQKAVLIPKLMAQKNVDAICYHIGTYGYG